MPTISLISEYFKCGCVNVDLSGVYTHTQPTPPEYFLNTVQANVPTDLFSPLITQMHTHISNMTDHETVNLVGDKKITEQSCMLLSKSKHYFLVQNQVTRHRRLLLHEAEHHWAFSPRTQGFFLFFVILISLMVVTLYLFFCRSIVVGHLVTSNCRRSGSNSGGTRTPQEERELKKVQIQLIHTLPCPQHSFS